MGLDLDPWQETVLRAGLGERANGKWAAHQVGLSAPRQNGKSQLIVARAIAGALLFGERLIVVSAHQSDTARETFNKFIEQIEANPALESRLRGGTIRGGVMNAINRESIKFANGATIKFKARTGTGGRGFSSDCLFLDEAQILDDRAWASINSTMSAMANPQVWLLGTPPTIDDDGVVFGKIRESALSKSAQSLAWCEWSAEPGDDPALEETRAKANPAWNTRINHEVVDGEYETYTRQQFALERLGIWFDKSSLHPPVIDPDDWDALIGPAPTDGRTAYGVRFDPSGAQVAISVAMADGKKRFVETLDRGSPTSRMEGMVDFLADRWRDCDAIVIDGRGAADVFEKRLLEAGVQARKIVRATTPQASGAYAGLLDLVETKRLRHSGQEGLTESIECSKRRNIGTQGAWGYEPNHPGGDSTPAESAALAISGLRATKTSANGRTGSGRSGGGRVGSVM